MKTIEDVVKEHAEKARHSVATSDGIEFLELEQKPEYRVAGNIYLAALKIINQLADKIEKYQPAT